MKIVDVQIENDIISATVEKNGTLATVRVDALRNEHAHSVIEHLLSVLKLADEEAETENCGSCVGACCTSDAFAVVEVTHDDCVRLAAHLGMERNKFIKKHVKVSPSPSTGALGIFTFNTTKRGKKVCQFLDVDKEGNGRCSVYTARPQRCRDFAAASCEVFIPKASLLKKNPGKYRVYG